VNVAFVEKQQTLLENGFPMETIMSLVENENYGAHKVDEKYLMKNTVCMKNYEPKFAKNVGWIQVGKKGKKNFSKKYKKSFYIKIEIQGKMECK